MGARVLINGTRYYFILYYTITNPDIVLPHAVALATVLGMLIEPYHRQLDRKAVQP
jgi:hypothetical protein